jgi:hypothetical protein
VEDPPLVERLMEEAAAILVRQEDCSGTRQKEAAL